MSLSFVAHKGSLCDCKQAKIATGQRILSDIHTQGVPDYSKGVLKAILFVSNVNIALLIFFPVFFCAAVAYIHNTIDRT